LSKITIKKVEDSILLAFSDMEPPPNDKLVKDNSGYHFDCNAAKAAFQGLHWKDVPLATVLSHPESLSAFTLEAFRFYLPAYLLASMFYYYEADVIPGNIVTDFKPPSHPYDRKRHDLKLRVFTRDQRDAIKKFFQFLDQEHGDDFLFGELQEATQALEERT
jgi:hypothetical protein